MLDRLTFTGVWPPLNQIAIRNPPNPSTVFREISLHGYTERNTDTGFENIALRIRFGHMMLDAPFLRDPSWTGSEVEWKLSFRAGITGAGTWYTPGFWSFRRVANGAQVSFGSPTSTLDNWLSHGSHVLFYLTCERVNSVKGAYLPAQAASCDAFSDHDVVLIFPNAQDEQNCLWAKRAVLNAASPYWQRLFNAGCSESTQHLGGLSKWKELLHNDVQGVIENYKDTAGIPTAAKLSDSSADTAGAEKLASSQISYIVVTDGDILTYRAVLVWLLTGDVTFSEPAKCEETEETAQMDVPLSPTSIYALTDKLEITELQKLALAEYTKRLTSKNAMIDLFSTHALLYPQLKDAALAAAVANWVQIKANKGTVHYRDAVREGEKDPEHLAEIMEELLLKV